MNDIVHIRARREKEVRQWLTTIIAGLETTGTQLARDAGLGKGTITRFFTETSHSLSDITLAQIKAAALEKINVLPFNEIPDQKLIDIINAGPGGCPERASVVSLIEDMNSKDLDTIKRIAAALIAPHIKK